MAGAATAIMVDFPEPGTGSGPVATAPSGAPGGPPGAPTAPLAPLGRVVPPDVLVVASRPVSGADLARIQKLRQVRDVITVDAGQVRIQGRRANAFGIDPVRFRSWTPPGTAARDHLWSALARDEFVTNESTAKKFGLRTGASYPIVAKTAPYVRLGGTAPLGVPGVDMLVNRRTGGRIGLVRDLGVMINAPGARMERLTRQLRKIFGSRSQVLNLHEPKNLPGDVPRGRPRTYLDLYKKAAASCPGLSWTVLAAIGQIESSHGRNTGPSSAGALGPMQFLPSTWRSYGVDGDGDGRADIMNPYDAVPAAAKYLCGYGAGRGGRHLSYAIWQYNHSDEYVNSVLALSRAYARAY